MFTFVVGVGQCGDMSLCTWLQQHGVRAVMEPHAERLIKAAVVKAETGKVEPITAKLLADVPRPHRNGCVVDENLSLFIEDLARMTTCRFVWLIQNPWDCISSLMAQKWYREPENRGRDDVFANNRLTASMTGEMSGQWWRGLPKIGKCAWYWKFLNLRIEQQLDELDEDQWMRVRLEDWSPVIARAVLRFVGGVEGGAEWPLPMTNAGRWNGERPRWTDDEMALVHEVAGTALWRWYAEGHFRSPEAVARWKVAQAEKTLVAR